MKRKQQLEMGAKHSGGGRLGVVDATDDDDDYLQRGRDHYRKQSKQVSVQVTQTTNFRIQNLDFHSMMIPVSYTR
jgi:hypothetical protein